MNSDKLVYMANQISHFFSHQDHAKAVAGIADHLDQFWDRRMRAAIRAHLDAGGAGMEPLVREAVNKIRVPVAVD